MDISCNRLEVFFQFYLWDQSHINIVWNTRETGDIIVLARTSHVVGKFKLKNTHTSLTTVSSIPIIMCKGCCIYNKRLNPFFEKCFPTTKKLVNLFLLRYKGPWNENFFNWKGFSIVVQLDPFNQSLGWEKELLLELTKSHFLRVNLLIQLLCILTRFECCAHPKAGQNTFLGPFSPFFVDYKCFSVFFVWNQEKPFILDFFFISDVKSPEKVSKEQKINLKNFIHILHINYRLCPPTPRPIRPVHSHHTRKYCTSC